MGDQLHGFSVDVEDYYQVLNFQKGISRSEWGQHESRVAPNTERILDLLEKLDTKGTFFILGCVAEEHPDLVRRIARDGHEIASHGFSHTPITGLSRSEFLEEARSSKQLLEDLSGQKVLGFRAPSFSIRVDTLWALDVLLEAGYVYDSSIFPIRHPDYGIPDSQRDIHLRETPDGGQILEFPMSVVRCLGRTLPISGGGYFRLFPWSVTRWGWDRLKRHGHHGVFYLHPWEVDPDQPDLRAHTSRLGAFRHYTGLAKTMDRLERMLKRYAFAPMSKVLDLG